VLFTPPNKREKKLDIEQEHSAQKND